MAFNHKEGYIEEYVNGKSILQHRRIMEEYLGRKLKDNEIVHHINEDKKDNRIKNLKVMLRAEHTILHKKPAPIVELACANCGIIFEKRKSQYLHKKRKGQKEFNCSSRCNGLNNHKKTLNLTQGNPTEDSIKKVKEGLNKGWTGYKIAKEYGLNQTTVYNIINNKFGYY